MSGPLRGVSGGWGVGDASGLAREGPETKSTILAGSSPGTSGCVPRTLIMKSRIMLRHQTVSHFVELFNLGTTTSNAHGFLLMPLHSGNTPDSTQGTLLRMRQSNPGWPCAEQTPRLLYYIFSPFTREFYFNYDFCASAPRRQILLLDLNSGIFLISPLWGPYVVLHVDPRLSA